MSTRWHPRNRKIHHPQGIVSRTSPFFQDTRSRCAVASVLPLSLALNRVSGQFEVLRSFCRHLLSLFHLDFISNWFDWQSIWYYWLVYLLHTIPWTSHNKLKKKTVNKLLYCWTLNQEMALAGLVSVSRDSWAQCASDNTHMLGTSKWRSLQSYHCPCST